MTTTQWQAQKERLVTAAEIEIRAHYRLSPLRSVMERMMAIMSGGFYIGRRVGGCYVKLADALKCSTKSVQRAMAQLRRLNLLDRFWVRRGQRAYDGRAAYNQHMEYEPGSFLRHLTEGLARPTPPPSRGPKDEKPRGFRVDSQSARCGQPVHRSHLDHTMGAPPLLGGPPPIGKPSATAAPPKTGPPRSRRPERIAAARDRLEGLAGIPLAQMSAANKKEFMALSETTGLAELSGAVHKRRAVLQRELKAIRATRTRNPLVELFEGLKLEAAKVLTRPPPRLDEPTPRLSEVDRQRLMAIGG